MALVSVLVTVVDKNDDPLEANVILNGGTAITTDLNGQVTLQYENGHDGISIYAPPNNLLEVIPTRDDTYRSYFNIFDYLPQSQELVIKLFELSDTTSDSSLLAVRTFNSNSVTAYKVSSSAITSLTWNFGTSTDITNTSIKQSFQYLTDGEFTISLTNSVTVDEITPPDISTSTTTVQSIKIKPTVSYVSIPEDYTEYENSLTNFCKSQCSNCDCEEEYNTKCIPVGRVINFTPTVIFDGNRDCLEVDSPVTISWSINGVEEFVQTVDFEVSGEPSESLEPLAVEFDVEGSYLINLKATDICGNTCQFEKTFIAGPGIKIERQGSKIISFFNFLNYTANKNIIVEVHSVESRESKSVVLQTYSRTDVDANEVFAIQLPTEGIFQLHYYVYDPLSLDTPELTQKFIVYEFEAIVACYRRFVQEVLCPDGDCTSKKLNAEKQALLTQFSLLATAFYASAKIKNNETNALFYFDETQLKSLYNSNFYLMKLKDICKIAGYNYSTVQGNDCVSCVTPN